MNKVIVAHHYWARVGGGELVVAATANSFERMGKEPVLVSTFYFDPAKYREWFGIDLTKYKVVSSNIKLGAFGLYSRLVTWIPVRRAIKSYNPEALFIDSSNYKPLVKKKRNYKLIEYIHFPLEAYPKFQDPAITERYSKFPLNVYWWGYLKIMKLVLRSNPFKTADLVLANSSWTAEVVKWLYGEKPLVLNPPIAPNVEIVSSPPGFEQRKQQIVMLGRFSEEKRYHWVISEIMPRLIKDLPNVSLKIIGGVGTKTSRTYFDKLNAMISRLSLQKNVELIPNAQRNLINHVMDSSRAFFHAMINEHWGISVMEAMARGLPAVTHRSGGTWTDILENGKYGLGYENPEESSENLLKLLTDEKVWKTYSVPQRASEFTLDKYYSRFADLTRGIF
ncbi:MAG: glycosyltransferase [Nitrososphaeria archaeon]